jgi:hypothetical protein
MMYFTYKKNCIYWGSKQYRYLSTSEISERISPTQKKMRENDFIYERVEAEQHFFSFSSYFFLGSREDLMESPPPTPPLYGRTFGPNVTKNDIFILYEEGWVLWALKCWAATHKEVTW